MSLICSDEFSASSEPVFSSHMLQFLPSHPSATVVTVWHRTPIWFHSASARIHLRLRLERAGSFLWPLKFLILGQIILNSDSYLLLEVWGGVGSNLSQVRKSQNSLTVPPKSVLSRLEVNADPEAIRFPQPRFSSSLHFHTLCLKTKHHIIKDQTRSTRS